MAHFLAFVRLVLKRIACLRKAQITMTQPSPALTVELAAQLARIALNGITREYPTYPDHILLDAADRRRTRELHPAFYGCFDWHSAVHSHWLLARLLRLLPALPEAGPIRRALNEHLTEANLRAEAAYFAQPGRRGLSGPTAGLGCSSLPRNCSTGTTTMGGAGRQPSDR